MTTMLQVSDHALIGHTYHSYNSLAEHPGRSFIHCGSECKRCSAGYGMTQQEFCQRMEPVPLAMRRQDEEALRAKETTQFISILGALLWLCLTRLGVIAEVALLQQEVTHPTIGHIATRQSGCCSCEEVPERSWTFLQETSPSTQGCSLCRCWQQHKEIQLCWRSSCSIVDAQ